MGLAVCGAGVRRGRSNVRFPNTPPNTEGTHEPEIEALSPAVYLKFGGDFSSTTGRNGTLVGSGGAFVAALASNVGTGNLAFDTEGTASISIAHAAADVALTFPSDWEALYNANPGETAETLLAPYRFIAAFAESIHFEVNALPTGSDLAVITAKSNADRTEYDGSWEAYFDADGAVHVELRSFRGRPCHIRTPDGMVSAGGGPYHLVVRADYDGLTAFLDGAQFEEGLRDGVSQGIPNLMHNYGLAADILGTTHANTHAWTIGKAAWGGQADITVDEAAIFLRRPSTTLSQSNVNTLAQVGSTPAAIPHHIWGALTVNESAYSGTAGTATRINNAIDDVSASGGGTVMINGGSYSGVVILKSNVRIRTTGTVNLSGSVRTSYFNRGTLTPAASFANGSRTLTAANSLAAGALVRVRGQEGATVTTAATLRYDRAYNTASQAEDPWCADGQVFEVESRTGSDLTFTGNGWQWPTVTSGNQIIETIASPTDYVAMEGDIRVVGSSSSSNIGILYILYCKNFRIIGADVRNTSDAGQAIRVGPDAIYGSLRNCKNRLLQTATENCDGIQLSTSCDVVAKDCEAFDGRHGCDFSGASGHNAAGTLLSTRIGFPSLRCEQHGLTWTQSGPAAPGKGTSFSAHGLHRQCMVWNSTANWGGPNFSGIGMDMRWIISGGPGGDQGEIAYTDGSDGCYLRDTHIIAPDFWFRTPGGVVSVDRCVFRNVTRSAAASGTSHNGEYGTGSDACHYSNVDAPWTTGATAWIEE